MSNKPVPGVIYTTEQLAKLHLLDSPCLRVMDASFMLQTVQDAHFTDEQLLAVPGFAELGWRYLYTTHEWIPIFVAVDPKLAWACLDSEPDRSPYCDEGTLWVTPKGLPREQYIWTD